MTATLSMALLQAAGSFVMAPPWLHGLEASVGFRDAAQQYAV
jgi:hypothetical protein